VPRAELAAWASETSEIVGVFEEAQHQEVVPVAVVTDVQAELVVMTLRVHGIDATAPAVSVFPSLDWAEGRAISVRLEDAALAAELLRGFGHEPLPETG
jgi:hypothetical protein